MAANGSAFGHNKREPMAAGAVRFALAAGLHAALAFWVWQAPSGKSPEPVPVRMDVRMVELSAPRLPEAPKPVPQPPKPLPQAAARTIVRDAAPLTPQSAPLPAPAAEPMPASVAAAPQAAVPAREEAPPASPAAVPVAVTAARFDADYLQNPAPVYPPLSRKLQEEGKVLVSVQVSAKGEAESVQIKQGSSFPRLDEAAMKAVRQWRFVPARRGSEPVASSVVVPLVFRLDS